MTSSSHVVPSLHVELPTEYCAKSQQLGSNTVRALLAARAPGFSRRRARTLAVSTLRGTGYPPLGLRATTKGGRTAFVAVMLFAGPNWHLSNPAEFFGQPDEKSFGSADVAEPIRVFVLDHFAADKLCAVLAEPGDHIVDVFHGKHDA